MLYLMPKCYQGFNHNNAVIANKGKGSSFENRRVLSTSGIPGFIIMELHVVLQGWLHDVQRSDAVIINHLIQRH